LPDDLADVSPGHPLERVFELGLVILLALGDVAAGGVSPSGELRLAELLKRPVDLGLRYGPG
jgi:hypothetical protein